MSAIAQLDDTKATPLVESPISPAVVSSAVSGMAAAQSALEDLSRREGYRRFHANLNRAVERGDAATAAGYKTLLARCIEPTAKVLSERIAMCEAKGKVWPVYLKYAKEAGPTVTAYLAVKACLMNLPVSPELGGVARQCATFLLDEVRMGRFQAASPGLYAHADHRSRAATHYGYKRTSMGQASRWAEAHPLPPRAPGEEPAVLSFADLDALSPTLKHHIGTSLVAIVMAESGLFVVARESAKANQARAGGGRRGRRQAVQRPLRLVATPATEQWLAERHEALEYLRPVFLPMLEPPLPWGPDGVAGGYRYALAGALDLIRGEHADAGEVSPPVYAALNSIQETAWAFNRRVLAVMDQARATLTRDFAGIPAHQPTEQPRRPADTADAAAMRTWKLAMRDWHTQDGERKSKCFHHYNALSVVDALDGALPEGQVCERFWFPHSLDFRGRVYPATNYLTPQGTDVSKGLLCFADGKPLGETGRTWLALHGARCLDVSPEGVKVGTMTLTERVALVERLTPRIVQTAADPWADLWWAEADEPWQFLAFCFEWADAHQYSEAHGGDVTGFVSRLPVGMDGSCNGLQHFAALMRDPVLARAVNVLPSARPEDIYQRSTDALLDLLQAEAGSAESFTVGRREYRRGDLALRWLQSGMVGRSLCKGPVMTFGYGSKEYGHAEQVKEYMKSSDRYASAEHYATVKALFRVQEDGTSLLEDACLYLAKRLWRALDADVAAAERGMRWMQAWAALFAKQHRDLQWTVPVTGFPVRQRYRTRQWRQVTTHIAGGAVWRSGEQQSTDTLDVRRQVNACAPNIIHSFDAACLMLTVNAAAAEGLTAFGAVHDSYSTHAGDADMLAAVLREQFVRFYTEGDVLAHLERCWTAATLKSTPECEAGSAPELPALPEVGDLDVAASVPKSLYFFA